MNSLLSCGKTDILHGFEELFNFPYWYKLCIHKQLSASLVSCQTESLYLEDEKPWKFKVATTAARL